MCVNQRIEVSFVVPIHNSEKTIIRTLDSICGLKHSYEVILCENGSSDDTEKTVQEYMKKNEFNIHLLHSDIGVSNARNKALSIAKGKWICFVDSDDLIDISILDEFLQRKEIDSMDLCMFNYFVGDKYQCNFNKEGIYQYSNEILRLRTTMITHPTRYMQVWSKLFKNSIIKEYNLFFNKNMDYSEDSDFTLRFTKLCSKILCSDKGLYHYCLNGNSVMHQNDGKKAKKYIFAMQETKKQIKNESSEIRRAFDIYILNHLNIIMVREIYSKNNSASKYEKNKLFKDIINEKIFVEAINNIQFKDCKDISLIPVFCIKVKLYKLAKLAFVMRARENWKKELAERK